MYEVNDRFSYAKGYFRFSLKALIELWGRGRYMKPTTI